MYIDPEFGGISSGYDFVDPILELGAHVVPTGVSSSYEGCDVSRPYEKQLVY